MQNKNILIEFYRFFFALVIALHHFRAYDSSMPYGGGYLAVDFFLIVSGFFLTESLIKKDIYQKNSLHDTALFAAKRYLRLWKEYIVVFAVSLLAENLILGVSFNGELPRYFSEALMLGFYSNASADCVIPAGWYCGYLMCGTIIILVLYALLKKKFLYISGALSLILYVFLLGFNASLCIYPKDACILSMWTLLRILAGLLVGCFIYGLSNSKLGNINSAILGPIIVVCFFILAYSLLWEMGFNRLDFVKVPVFAVMFLLSVMMGNKIRPVEGIRKVTCYAGDVSYTMFLSHFLIVRAFCIKGTTLHALDWKQISFAYLIIVIIVATVLHFAINRLFKLSN